MNEQQKSMKLLVTITVAVVIAIVISLIFVFNRKDTQEYDNKLEQAQKYVEELDYKRAETTYLEAIKIDSKQPKAYIKLADVYVADEQVDKAIKILDKGLKNVDKDNQKEISEKKKKIEKQAQIQDNNQDVINNGGYHVTYDGRTYYWKYSSDSLYSASMHVMYSRKYIEYKDDKINTLVSLDKNGKEETIYEGTGYGKLWIYNQRIYSEKSGSKWFSIKLDGTDEKLYDDISDINAISDNGLIVSTSNYNIALLEKNDEVDVIKEESTFCYFENNIVYYETRYELSTNGKTTNETLNFGSIDVNGKNDFTLVNLSVEDWYGDDYDFDYSMSVPVTVDCVQIIDDNVYFQYGGYDGSSYIYQGGKIAKIKKDGTGFMNLKDIEEDGDTSFTVYKNGDDVEIKTKGSLNKPFCEYEYSNDYSSSSTTVSIYTDENSDKKELISKDEYKTINSEDLTELDYTGNELYFTAIKLDEDGYYVQKCTFYKKDLKSNKIEKIQEISLENN